MTTSEVFEKMERLRISREQIAKRLGAYPHTLTNFKQGVFTLTTEDAARISEACDQILADRVEGREVVRA